ncbi:FUSC family protein [Kitasatospora sp. NPDC048194]|uniref:FUSC family protein n=1 Tax=Kitasatospora sp. NPDC048194 TaxID=3364045 RepID=UPI00371CE76C
MARALKPPGWLTEGLRPRDAPVPWAAVARASVALAAPLAVGTATGQPGYGALVSMGALSGVIGDTADAYRMRVYNIAVPQLFGALGVLLGTQVYGTGWTAVAVLTLVALLSGMISSIGAVASVSGLLLLLNAVVGAGLPLPSPWWLPPALLLLGGLLVLALTLLAWPLRGGTPERGVVADTYRAVAALLEATGSPGYDAKRHELTRSLNQSYDLLLARRARRHGRSPTLVRLLAQLNALVPVVEAVAAVQLRPPGSGPPPSGYPAAVRALADVVERGRTAPADGRPAPPDLPEPRGPSTRALAEAIRHAEAVVHEAAPDPYAAGDRLGRPAALEVRARLAARTLLLSGGSWRYGLRLAVCIGLAQVLVSVIAVPRSYWVTLTVTFVMKPDFGSVFSRAVLRALGTAAGLLIAVPVLAEVPHGWWDVPVMAALAMLIPALSVKGYAFQTAAITPVILLLSDLLNHQGFHLVLPRLYDSLIGCGIALLVGYLLWPESWHTRIGERLADAVQDTASYVGLAFTTGPGRDEPARARYRRRLYRDLSAVRSEFQRALTEPPPVGTRAEAWWPLVIAVERIVDTTTATRVRVEHGAAMPTPAEVGAVTRQLTDLADALRTGAPLRPADGPGAPEGPEGPDGPAAPEGPDGPAGPAQDGALARLRHEVHAARSVAAP